MSTPRKRPEQTPERLRAWGRLGAEVLHSRYDAREITAPARAAFAASFEESVDPQGVLDPDERRRRAQHARSAYMRALALQRHYR